MPILTSGDGHEAMTKPQAPPLLVTPPVVEKPPAPLALAALSVSPPHAASSSASVTRGKLSLSEEEADI